MTLNKKNNVLFLFTDEFPYGIHESYLENEITFLSTKFKTIFLIPGKNTNDKTRDFPENVVLLNNYREIFSNYSPFKLFLKEFFLILKILAFEFIRTGRKKFFLKNLREFNSSICQCITFVDSLKLIIKNIGESGDRAVFYSYWMNDGALICSILKEKKVISDFIFRVHGFDLYDDRRKGNYMPFRFYNMRMARKIYTVSKAGLNYLKGKTKYSDKIKLSYLGVFDKGVNPFNNKRVFTIVSCSNLVPLKRVMLIVEILKEIKFPVRWVHFGDGVLRTELLYHASHLPSNIHFEFKGATSNNDILKFYKEENVNLFVHLSETEGGVPVVLQEASSFGIPLLGADSGGVKEIVNEQTGILLASNFEIKEVVNLINEFKNSEKNTPEFRKGVRMFWSQNFNAETNYQNFFNEVSSLI